MKHSYRAVDSTEFTAFSISKGMFMNLLKYKGKHIRVSDKSLVFRFSAGSLFLLFLAVIMLLNLKSILTTDWKSVSFLQDGNVHLVVTPYRIVTIVVAALVCVLAAYQVHPDHLAAKEYIGSVAGNRACLDYEY